MSLFWKKKNISLILSHIYLEDCLVYWIMRGVSEIIILFEEQLHLCNRTLHRNSKLYDDSYIGLLYYYMLFMEKRFPPGKFLMSLMCDIHTIKITFDN
jgi:hypothetical protein